MPRLDTAIQTSQDMENFGGGAFQFSGAGMADLAERSSEFSLVTLAVDMSYSVSSHVAKLEEMTRRVLKKAQDDPNSEKILFRLLTFATEITEVFGFKPASEINIDAVTFQNGGTTALYQVTEDSIRATLSYAEQLYDQEFVVNALVMVMTDGENISYKPATVHSVKKAMDELTAAKEKLSEVNSVLIGVGPDAQVQNFQQDAGITTFIPADDFSDDTIKRIGNFVSRSISSASQSIANGDSQAISF